ncbi:MAG: hypothetical protein ABSA03_06840 [Streptosporangiaceae bacterium]|jgi:hypothetical protein
MEAIIGFVAGYLVGSREGKAGLDRLRTSWDAIRTSPEVRRMAGEAAVVAEAMVRRAASGGLSGTVSGVTDLIASRAASRQGQQAA